MRAQIDNGKSTVAGHLLLQTGAVSARHLEKLQAQATEAGKGSFKYAWVLDRFGSERERGITVDMKVCACVFGARLFLLICIFKYMSTYMKSVNFATPKYDVNLVDTPGHEAYIKNMVGGTSQAEAAIVVVSADSAELDASLSEHGQTREHVLLAYTMGIKQLIVIVNKMDLVGLGPNFLPFASEQRTDFGSDSFV